MAETVSALCFGRAAQGRVFLREGPSVLPQPSSLSLSFLPLYQLIPISSPSEVSIPALAALPWACSFADRTQVPSIPNCGRQYQSSLCKTAERKGLGGQSSLQSFAVGKLRGTTLAHEMLTTLLLRLLRRISPSTCRGF